jgi:hypothetical protein
MALLKRVALVVVAPLRRILVQPVLHAVNARAAQTDRIAAAGFEGLEDSLALLARRLARITDPVPATTRLVYAIDALRRLERGARVAVIEETAAVRAALSVIGFVDGADADAVLILDATGAETPAAHVRPGGLVVLATGDEEAADRLLAELEVLDRTPTAGAVLATARRPTGP